MIGRKGARSGILTISEMVVSGLNLKDFKLHSHFIYRNCSVYLRVFCIVVGSKSVK